ncbi:FAM63B [Cordylochernes scorpioides]|uniref:Ubiquitin carboxyl-terminal hydrolase n=1 Tax=Cordylochernes scorpioides TaxID=51811 RepID=A0ABY6LK34_9ARAC|nr:FAM63B [Cordylochernes scorpioides]
MVQATIIMVGRNKRLLLLNVLILSGHINLPHIIEVITPEQLMEYVGDCILENIPRNIPEAAQLNYEQNMQDAIAILPKLQTGLDVNVRFTGVQDFEYTPECIVFDLLHIPLYHGWLVDPQTPETAAAVAGCSYNQLVEKIIINKVSPRVELVTEGVIFHKERFYCITQQNLWCSVRQHVCVQNELFQLVTDQGFLTEPSVVWETLNNIEGDGEFVDGDFLTVPPKNSAATPSNHNLSTEQQISQE